MVNVLGQVTVTTLNVIGARPVLKELVLGLQQVVGQERKLVRVEATGNFLRRTKKTEIKILVQ